MSDVYLIQHELELFGYQVFQKKNGEFEYLQDLDLLVPEESYSVAEKDYVKEFRLPLLRALHETKLNYSIEKDDENNEIIHLTGDDFKKLSEHLFEVKLKMLQQHAEECRKNAVKLTERNGSLFLEEVQMYECQTEKYQQEIDNLLKQHQSSNEEFLKPFGDELSKSTSEKPRLRKR